MAVKTKTRKMTVKKVKKPAIEKMLEESVSPREDQINETEMSVPADSIENFETVALSQEVENLKRENEELKQEIIRVKENSKKLGELFESYEIELLKTENESLKSEIEKLKSQLAIATGNMTSSPQQNVEHSQNQSKSTAKYNPGSRLANAREPIMTPTNGYETW